MSINETQNSTVRLRQEQRIIELSSITGLALVAMIAEIRISCSRVELEQASHLLFTKGNLAGVDVASGRQLLRYNRSAGQMAELADAADSKSAVLH